MENIKIIRGGVTAAKGFLAAGACTNMKYKDRKDMALIYSKKPAKAAGVFTTNVVKAAPVQWDINCIENEEEARAVVLNSGIANACTGKEGEAMNLWMASQIAENLGIPANQVLTASTGVIGMQMKKEPIAKGAKMLAKSLSDSLESGRMAAEAIMTTDTVIKEYAVAFELGGKTISIGGMAKGSGMIHPNMATMLSVITTDACISKDVLQKALSEDVKDSFNMVSVDRDTSTNDTVLLLANGMASNEEIKEGGQAYRAFKKALAVVTKTLAKKMAADGEGATKLVEVRTIRARDKEEAVGISKSVVSSNLVKTAMFGSDANCGRVLCAMGYSGEDFNPNTVDLRIESAAGGLTLMHKGVATDYSEELATKILSEKEVAIILDLDRGDGEAVAWGCDLTYDYIKINADYRS